MSLTSVPQPVPQQWEGAIRQTAGEGGDSMQYSFPVDP